MFTRLIRDKQNIITDVDVHTFEIKTILSFRLLRILIIYHQYLEYIKTTFAFFLQLVIPTKLNKEVAPRRNYNSFHSS